MRVRDARPGIQSESMKSNDWIRLLAYEARRWHAADCRRNEEASARQAAVCSRVLAELRCAVALGVDGFLSANRNQPARALTCEDAGADHGFIVSHTDSVGSQRSVTVDLKASSLRCRYERCTGAISGALSAGMITIEIHDGAALCSWNEGLMRKFVTVDVLCAFLLEPILAPASLASSVS